MPSYNDTRFCWDELNNELMSLCNNQELTEGQKVGLAFTHFRLRVAKLPQEATYLMFKLDKAAGYLLSAALNKFNVKFGSYHTKPNCLAYSDFVISIDETALSEFNAGQRRPRPAARMKL